MEGVCDLTAMGDEVLPLHWASSWHHCSGDAEVPLVLPGGGKSPSSLLSQPSLPPSWWGQLKPLITILEDGEPRLSMRHSLAQVEVGAHRFRGVQLESRGDQRSVLSCWTAPFLVFWLEKAGCCWGFFLCVHGCSGLPVASAPTLRQVRQEASPGIPTAVFLLQSWGL